MFEERLINEIRMYRCLWDKFDVSYRDRDAKELAWRDLAVVVGESEINCRKRWKSLRDRFIIQLKLQQQPRRSAAPLRKSWPYFDMLAFLKETVMPRKTTTNILKDEDLESSFCFDVDESGDLTFPSQTEDSEPSPPKRRKRANHDDENNFKSLVDDVTELVKAQANVVHDNILGVIGDIFQKIPQEKQFDFKMDVLKYVHNKFKELETL